tara:strand:- start:1152 stop:2015 length:864 start_codon:yes stop_codon:yes gene_type:complete
MSRYITGGATGASGGSGGGGGGGTVRQERFISSGTFNVPSGVTSAEVLLVAGGGGGGRGYSWQVSHAGGGGQGGQVKCEVVDLTGIASCAIIIGSGGQRTSHSSSDSYNSYPGGKSSFTYSSNVIECVGGRQGIGGGVGGMGGPHWQDYYNSRTSPDGDNYGYYSSGWWSTTGGHTRGAGGHGRGSDGSGNYNMHGMPGMYGYGGGGGGGYYSSSNSQAKGGQGSDGGGVASCYDWWHGGPGGDNQSKAYHRWGERNTGGGGAGGNYNQNEEGGSGAAGICIVTYTV